MINRHEFLEAVFPADMLDDGEVPCIAHPDFFVKGGKRVDYYRKYTTDTRGRAALDSDQGWLMCVSTVKAQKKITSAYADILNAFVLPLDDIGTKAKAPAVEPSYILETSPGNFQYGYLLDPFDVSSEKGANYYDGCLVGLAEAGYNDPGVRLANRLVKLPGAIHRTGFVTQLREWHPDRAWGLKKLMRQFGVKAARVSKKKTAFTGLDDLGKVDDPLLDWLRDNGFVQGEGYNGSWVHVQCPWGSEHSHKNGGSSTSYSPLDYGTQGRAFHCMHGHCQQRTVQDLIQFAKNYGFTGDLDATGMASITARVRKLIEEGKL